MRDVDAFKERIACDWGHPQGYKKNAYLLLSKKQKTKYLKANQNMHILFWSKILESWPTKNLASF